MNRLLGVRGLGGLIRDLTHGLITTATIGVTCCLPLAAAQAAGLPTFQQVRASHLPSDFTLLDRDGQPLQTLRRDPRVRRLPWVTLDEVSPAMRTAIVLSEDQRFWQHSGIDWQGVAASAWSNLWNERTRGASTLTMQLAGLLDERGARPAGGRNWSQKATQAWAARQLEARWRKSEILEAYLNHVPFRGELVGLPALSQTLFGKHPSGLDAQESAIAAALVRGPNARAHAVARRACQVLTLQQRPCAGIDLVVTQALARKGGPALGEQRAPHLARLLMAQAPADAPSVRSTLDGHLQRLAQETLQRHLLELAHRQVEDGAVIVIDNARGEVLAWVGGSGALSQAAQVDAVLALRQPGSTLKPFVYGLAFERRLLTPASLLQDEPVQLPTGAGLYIPQNYDRRFRGWVSVRTALGNSLNVPAVRAGAMLGADALAEGLRGFGLALKEPGGFYGPGLALGSAELTLRDLSNAYRALANGGRWSPLRLQVDDAKRDAKRDQAGAHGTATPSQVGPISPAAAHLVTDILADNGARALSFGLHSALATRGFAAVKTGTSKDMRDNWCIGYTDRYTVGVWVGNASGSPMHDVSGVAGAAPVWASLVQALHRERPSRAPDVPPGVRQQRIHFEASAGASMVDVDRLERFIEGTEQATWRLDAVATSGAAARPGRAIVSPKDGAIFALDPDIPPRAQRVMLRSQAVPPGQSVQSGQPVQPALAWWLDGRRLATGAQHDWLPMPGRHVLSLRQHGQVLDEIRFEVRGASLIPCRATTPCAASAGPSPAPSRGP
ncbi:MAG: penicillin-binding protein 1C [Aquabacterium commune]|uniref:penicillin-binding protein 1C n=1 Tax=Aquabacterium commune TaxID=70586 RepID=UPI003BB04B48